jgi:hypothetical protein
MLQRVSAGLVTASHHVGRVLPALIRELAGLAGAGLIAYGAWLVYAPAGFVTGGILLLAGSLAAAARS